MAGTAVAQRPARAAAGTAGVTWARVVRSEWIKLRSLRSTLYTLAASVAITVGLGILFCSFIVARWSVMTAADRAAVDPVSTSIRGVLLAQLAMGVLGVLFITGEYATGQIRATLAAVPRRLPVLAAKLGVFAVAATVVSVISTVLAFLIGQAILSAHHVGVSLADPGVARAVIGAGLYLAGVGLLGMALGFIFRATAGSIATLYGILLVLPLLADVLPSTWAPHIVPYLPGNAGTAVMQVHPDPHTLAPWTGFGLFLGYVAVAVVAAAVLLRRRDA
jgi:ABC-2 type transport system permease protein